METVVGSIPTEGTTFKKQSMNMSKTWFTSDTHFGHNNIISYSKRPYRDKFHMDGALIKSWNECVGNEDIVYHLGDAFFVQERRALEILDQLNGKKILILGNHDKLIRESKRVQEHFSSIHDYLEINIERQHIVLCHYPMITWNGAYHGSWMLHGHCHGNLKYPFDAKIHDVGVDPNGYKPISFEELKRLMDKRKIAG